MDKDGCGERKEGGGKFGEEGREERVREGEGGVGGGVWERTGARERRRTRRGALTEWHCTVLCL